MRLRLVGAGERGEWITEVVNDYARYGIHSGQPLKPVPAEFVRQLKALQNVRGWDIPDEEFANLAHEDRQLFEKAYDDTYFPPVTQYSEICEFVPTLQTERHDDMFGPARKSYIMTIKCEEWPK